jgi:hypothetical protein
MRNTGRDWAFEFRALRLFRLNPFSLPSCAVLTLAKNKTTRSSRMEKQGMLKTYWT